MNRRSALALLAGLCAVLHAAAQNSARTTRIGFLSGASRASAGGDLRGILLEALAGLGYVDGRNITWVERYAETDFTRLEALAGELARMPVDIILTQTTPATAAAAKAGGAIPVVSVTSGDLVGAGLVASLARPGGNVTGLSFLGPELAVKQMALLKEMSPRIRRIALIATLGVQPEVSFLREMRRAAPALDLSVVSIEMEPRLSFEKAFEHMLQEKIDAALVAASVANRDDWQETVALALRVRMPLMFPFAECVSAGGLVSYGINRREFYAGAARFVDRILKGAKPADLPVEQPTRFELVVNRKTAAALGFHPPLSFLTRADRVIE